MFALFIGCMLCPIGLLLIFTGLKRRPQVFIGLTCLMLSIYPIYLSWEVLGWQFDLLRGWDLRIMVEQSPYTVTLVQEPGVDFYNTYFEVVREDGKMASVLIDGDDSKWRNPKVVPKAGKIYFVRGVGMITDRTSYVDVKNDQIYSGDYQRMFSLSRLSFQTPENYRPDTIPKPFDD